MHTSVGHFGTPEVPNDSMASCLVLCCSLCLHGSWVEVTRAGTVSRAASLAPASVTAVLLTAIIHIRASLSNLENAKCASGIHPGVHISHLYLIFIFILFLALSAPRPESEKKERLKQTFYRHFILHISTMFII